MDILISEFIDESVLSTINSSHRIHYDPQLVGDRSRLLELVTNADALIVRNKTEVDVELLSNASRLKVVGRLGVGLDNIDLEACSDRGIHVFPAVGANNVAVAEYVIAVSLIMHRPVFHVTDRVLSGEWPRSACVGAELFEKTLALVGFGGIAQEVAKRAAAFGMRICAVDPNIPESSDLWDTFGVRPVSLKQAAVEADVLSVHVPYTQQNHHLIEDVILESMKSTSIVINTARGKVIDTDALIRHLRSGSIAGAVLDVFETEPMNNTDEFNGINVLLTPHIAGITAESNERVSHVTLDSVIRALDAS